MSLYDISIGLQEAIRSLNLVPAAAVFIDIERPVPSKDTPQITIAHTGAAPVSLQQLRHRFVVTYSVTDLASVVEINLTDHNVLASLSTAAQQMMRCLADNTLGGAVFGGVRFGGLSFPTKASPTADRKVKTCVLQLFCDEWLDDERAGISESRRFFIGSQSFVEGVYTDVLDWRLIAIGGEFTWNPGFTESPRGGYYEAPHGLYRDEFADGESGMLALSEVRIDGERYSITAQVNDVTLENLALFSGQEVEGEAVPMLHERNTGQFLPRVAGLIRLRRSDDRYVNIYHPLMQPTRLPNRQLPSLNMEFVCVRDPNFHLIRWQYGKQTIDGNNSPWD